MKQKKILLNILCCLLLSGWLSAQEIEDFQVNENGGRCEKTTPSIGVDNSGNFVIVWQDWRNGNPDIYCQRYSADGTTLGANFKVNDDAGNSYEYNPSVAVDNSGNFVIVWEDRRNIFPDIYCQRYSTDGTALGTNFKVNDNTGYSNQINPSIAVDNSGHFVIAWEDVRNGNSDICYQRFGADGTALGVNIIVNDDAASSNQNNPSIAVEPSGNFVIVWVDDRNGSFDIYCQRFDSDGTTKGTNFKVNEEAGSTLQYYTPSIAVDTSGNFIITWLDTRNGNHDIYCQRYSENGTAMGVNFKVNDNTGSSFQYTPSIAVDTSGNFVIVWTDNRNGYPDIYCQRYSLDGTVQGVNFQVNDDTGDSNQYTPSITADNGGNFVITWQDNRMGFNDIYCQRCSADGTTLDVNFRVNDDTGSSNQNNPSIAVEPSGNFMIVWEDHRNGNSDIYCQRYNSDGTVQGDNFMVNDNADESNQYVPSIAVDGSGNFVVVWQDYRNVNGDIYCQRYTADGVAQGDNFMVNENAGGSNQTNPSIAVDGGGNFVIAWMDYRYGNYDIYCQRCSSNGTALGNNFRVNEEAGDEHENPSIAVDSSGNFVVVWGDDRNGSSDIYCQRYSAEGTIQGSNFQVNDDAGSSFQFDPSIAVDGSGHFVIVWRDYRNVYADIYHQYYDQNGTALGANIKSNDDTGIYNSNEPSVAMDNSGNFVIVWEDDLNDDFDIYCQRYDNNNQLIGSNERINNQTDSDQHFSEVKLRDGTIYTVWETDHVPGQGVDIFANVRSFEIATKFWLSIRINPEGAGSVIRSPDYAEYDSAMVVELGAVPNPGYYFVGWSGNVTDSTSLKTTVIMDSDKTVTANFQMDPFSRDTTHTLVTELSTSVGSGWADVNLDNYPDLFISCSGEDNQLYGNNKDGILPGILTRITNGEIVNSGGDSWSASWGDYDNDGDPDLYIANYGENNFFYENNGDNTFNRIQSGEIVNNGSSSFGCSWGDYDNDGFLDLFVANWGQNNELYHNEQNGSFSQIIEGNMVTDVESSSGCSWADFNNDGDLDLFVSNNGNNALYINNGNGSFSPVTQGDIVTNGLNSFGGSWGDYDNDGDLDLFVPNGSNQNNFLYNNNGDGSFIRINEGELVNDGSSSLSSSWGDFDNDGDLDLFVANRDNEKNGLYANQGDGSFSQMILTIVAEDSGQSYSGSWCDFDRDGDIDLFVANWNDYNFLYMNNGNNNNWINIRCTGEITNPSAIGTKVRMKANIDGQSVWQMREISGQTGRISQNSMNAQFGLGDATIVDSIQVEWPSGIIQVLTSVNVNQFLVITEGFTNRPPVVANTINDTTIVLNDTLTIDLAADSIFTDPDGDTLTYSALSSGETIGSVSVIENMLVIIAQDTGRTTITVWANDGKDSVATSFEVTITLLSNQPPSIVHEPLNTSTVDQAITITAAISDDQGILSAFLYYRRGGDVLFTSTSMSQNDQVYQAMIPDYAVTSRGVEYYMTATDNNNVQIREPMSGIYSMPVQIPSPGVIKSSSQPAGSEQTAYRLTSVPIDVTDKTPGGVYTDDLGSYDMTKYRFFTLESDTGYTEFPGDPVMKPGTAGWLIVKDAGKVIDTGEGVTNPTSEEYSIPLRSGWNFVATPFNFTIPKTNLRLGSGNIIELRYYDGSWNNPDVIQVETLVPFEGYGLFNTLSSEDTLFVDPDLSSGAQASKKNEDKNEKPLWAIHILARCQQALDMDNTLKIMTTASKGPDPLDRPEPPSIGEYVSLHFSHPEWETNTRSFCIDSRPELLEGDVWSFEVKTNINDVVELTFEDLKSVPEPFEVWLVDEALKITQDLRQRNICTIAVSGKEHPKALKLFVGLHEFCEEGLQKMVTVPNTFSLYQNFPNPFNPTTTIRYGLPKGAKVTLKIYNLMGGEVKTLVNSEIKEAGYHVVIWDGRTQRGNPAAAGLYFTRMRAGGFTQTRKMILVE